MNNSNKYFDKLTILLHWVMALLIFFLFGLGLYMVDLSYYDPWYRGSTALHKSIGVGVFLLLFLRLIWRLMQGKNFGPSHSTEEFSGIEKKLARTMHICLYLLMATICISGYMISTAGGRELEVFYLFKLPALPIEIAEQEDLAGWWHFYLAWGIIIMVIGHTLAALKHHFLDKNNVLRSMCWPSKNNERDS